MRQWARLVTAHPVICAVVSVALTIVLGAGLLALGFDIRPNATITADNQITRDLEKLKSRFGADDNDIVVMAEGAELLQWERLLAYRELRDKIREIPAVENVASIFDVRRRGSNVAPLIPKYAAEGFDPDQLQSELRRHPVSANQLISADGQMLVMWVRIGGESLAVSTITSVVDSVAEYARQYQQASDANVWLAGHPAVRADVLGLLRRAMFVSCATAAVASFIVAMLLFRALAPVLVVISAPAVGAVWTFGLIGWCGVPIGGLMTALPNLVFVIGLTNAVHLLLDGQKHLRAGRVRSDAVYRMLMRIAPACFLTSLTTMIGFGSLMISRSDSVQNFGFWAALGTTLVMLADVLVLPTIMHWVPGRHLIDGTTDHQRTRHWLQHMIAPTLRHPRVTTFIAIVLCLLMIGPALRQQPDIIWTEAIPDDSSSTIATRRSDEKLGGSLVAYVMITWPDQLAFPDRSIVQATSKTQKLLMSAPEFAGPFSILNVLAAMNGSAEERFRNFKRAAPKAIQQSLINSQANSLVVSARVPNDGAAALNERVKRLNAKLQDLANTFPDFEFTVTGTIVAASQNMNAIIMDLAKSLAIAAVLVFGVFAVAFRSLKVGLLSAIPNAFPLLVAAAGLSLAGYPLQITTAMTFSLCLGLAVDDTMHVLIRHRAVTRYGCDSMTAIQKTIDHVGPALIVTTLILLVGFLTMMTSPLPSIRMYAAFSGLTLVTALVGDLLILPAMLVVAGKR